jgi:exopolysaccharide production protein ExoZ
MSGSSASRARHDLLTVQALRAIAALLVVAYHAIGEWGTHVVGRDADSLWGNGSAGVDVFFVISGLVMVISAARVADKPNPGWRFLRQRLTRILPLYWVVTSAKIAAVLALPALVARTQLDLPYVLGSYALLPVHDATGTIRPVLPVGWTLSYEMLFYLLVALALALRVPLLRVAAPVLLAFAGFALMVRPEWPPIYGFANTIVLEFLFGVLIGLWLQHDRRLPHAGLATVLLVGGFALLLSVPAAAALRPLNWGLPAAAIVLGAVALEPWLAPRLPRWLLASGDASYSVYLTHGFAIPVVFLLARRAGLAPAPLLIVTLVGGLLVSALLGQATHIVLERPAMAWFRRRRTPAAVIVAG